MKRPTHAWLSAAILLVLATTAALEAQAGTTPRETALDRYVAKADPSFRWKLVSSTDAESDGKRYTFDVIELVSQSWRAPYEVDRTEWTHWLTLVRPEGVARSRALLYIGGGRNGQAPPEAPTSRTLRLALETGSIVADLGQVPNQPLHFADSRGHGRSEDDLIAYSRVKQMITGDDEWLARLPMVKSGVRALDAIQEFLRSDDGGGLDVTEFVVAGGSKRGWTTWLVGAVDERVVAIMPLVIDALNTEAITRHHFAAYGFFSRSLGDYVRHGLYPHKLGTPDFAHVLRIEDPFAYRHRPRLRIPKYVINASGDQYFLPDNSRFYFQQLPDEKHLRYVPNAKHNLAGSDARDSMIAFYLSVLDDVARPTVTWAHRGDGAIEVTSDRKPSSARLWQAHNAEARDFRLDTIGAAWSSTTLDARADGSYVAAAQVPSQGFVAFFAELTFDLGGPYPLKVTTDVSILPDRLPHRLEGATGPWLQGWKELVEERSSGAP